jgi:hypothetical protein
MILYALVVCLNLQSCQLSQLCYFKLFLYVKKIPIILVRTRMLGLLRFDLFGESELNSRKYWGYLKIRSGALSQRLDVQAD